MRKAILYIISLCSLLVYSLSLHSPFMEWWALYRTYTLSAAPARARYGDLYSMSFLPGYVDTAFLPLKKYDQPGNTDLYIIHDSYLADKLDKTNFKYINRLVTSDFRNGSTTFKLDDGRRNILIIECSERSIAWRLTDTANLFLRMHPALPDYDPGIVEPGTDEFLMSLLFNPNINQNLEFSLYDYEWFIPIKEAKAWINYSLFKKLPPDVTISTNEKYLLLNETVDPRSNISSFAPLDRSYLDYVIKCQNYILQHCTKVGFDEVYFSLIPNPVTILDPNRMAYNHKIEFVEQNPQLKARVISVYSVFQNTNQQIYRRDDTHWNGRGIQLWVDEVNKRLKP